MPDETHDAASNAQAAVRWAEREFATTNLIHGREGGGYSIIVRTSDDPLLAVNQLLMVTLLDEFLSDHTASEIAPLLDNWQVGQAMREVGRSQRVVVTTHGLPVEARLLRAPDDRVMSPLSAILWRAASSPTYRAPAGNVTGLSLAVLSTPSNPHNQP